MREEDRRLAIERERGKARKVVSVEELSVRPEVPLHKHSTREDRAKLVKDGAATLRRKGVLVVRALEEFKGKLTAEHKGKSARKGLKFKPDDVIKVTTGSIRDTAMWSRTQ